MQLHFCGDIHLGNHRRHGGSESSGLNERCRMGLRVLADAVAKASAAGSAALVLNGDLFDTSRPSPQLLTAVQQIFRSAQPLRIIALVGNHDQDSLDAGDHALGPLADYVVVAESPRVCMLDDGGERVELVCLPYNPAAAGEWLPGVLQELVPELPGPGVTRLLSVHLGIADDETAPWLRGARDAVHVDALTALLQKHGIVAAFAGNWHNYAFWEDPGFPAIVQCGALVPTGWDNPGIDQLGGLATFDTELQKSSMAFLPGPRFVKTTAVEEIPELIARANRQGHQLFLQAAVLPENAGEAMSAVGSAQASGGLAAGEVILDATEAKAAARTAAHAARSKETLQEALSAFVASMPIDEGLSRDDVLSRARGYLSRRGAAA